MAGIKTLSTDVETFSSVDLGDCGLHKYMESPDFEVLLIGYSVDGGPVRVLDLTDPETDTTEFKKLLMDPAVVKTAWNAPFEMHAFKRWTGEEMPPEQWSDTMIMALEMGLPGSLAGAGAALGLPEDQLKDPVGKSLIQYFSKPCKPTKTNGGRTRNMPQHDPEKWTLYQRYNKQDVVTEMAIRKKLLPLVDSEQALWCLDQRMNDHGVRIDLPMVRKIVDFDTKRREELQQEARELTGLGNPNSLSQLKPWLASRGAQVETLRKDDLDQLLGQDLPADVRRVLEIRKALGKTSTAKYGTMLEATCADGRLRGILQFYGANRSGRWAGRIVQTHNLARNSLPDLELARQLTAQGDFETLETLFGETAFVFSELVRTAFIPSAGCRFCVSDFSAIEARVIAWIAGEQWVLDAFRAGKDIYCETASMMYHVPVVKHGENGELRQKGKIATLACGYQGGVGAMKAMDSSGSIPEDEMQSIVDHWRQANPMIVKLWRDYEAAAKTAIKERRAVRRGIRLPADNLQDREYMARGPVRPYSVREGVAVEFYYKDGNLLVRLPSGRRLCYYHARIRELSGGREQITYMGVNQTTKQWQEVETYGGKIVENIVQATARDCLAEAMTRVAAMGYQIVMHVHDEMIVDVPVEDTEALARINKAMSDPISWAPGLPLRGDGYETAFYRKD